MVVPLHIGDISPLDPSLVLPLPQKLPSDPTQALEMIHAAIEAQLDSSTPSSSKIPIHVLTAQMRLIHRNAHTMMNAARAGTAESRESLDRVDVDLRTIEYERDRVRDEIGKCAEYAPEYEKLELQDLQSFLDGLTEEQRAELPAPDDESYGHTITIARLENELAAIIQREELLASLTKEQESVIKTKKEIKHRFDAVDTYLGDFAKTTNAVSRKIKDVGGSSSST